MKMPPPHINMVPVDTIFKFGKKNSQKTFGHTFKKNGPPPPLFPYPSPPPPRPFPNFSRKKNLAKKGDPKVVKKMAHQKTHLFST